MVARVAVKPDLLQWAVERAGWDSETAQQKAPQLEKWLDGSRLPTLKQLEKFASSTHIPFGFLFLEEPPIEDVPIPDMRTIGNKAVPQPSADLLDTIYLCQSRQEWFRDHAQEYGLEQPLFIGTATLQTPSSRVAEVIRRTLHFEIADRHEFVSWETSFRALIDRIEEMGVLVMVNGVVGNNNHRKLDPVEFRGFALADEWAPLIFINGADTKATQNFTIIHKLAHLYLGHSALSDATMTATDGFAEELWCNQVAAEVLVPLEGIRTDYRGDTTLDELRHLSTKYRASTLVALRRIFDAGLIDWDNYRRLYSEERDRLLALVVRKQKRSGGGSYYNTQPLRLSRHFARAVIASTLHGSTSYRDAYSLLGVRKHSTFEKLAAQLGVI